MNSLFTKKKNFHAMELDGNYCEPEENSGCQTHFYFDYEHDVIEEDALNKKSCIEVLRILIAKEDMEIEQLEQDLSSLQIELQLEIARQERCQEYYSEFREMNKSLHFSINTLKNDRAHYFGTKPRYVSHYNAYGQQQNAVLTHVSTYGTRLCQKAFTLDHLCQTNCFHNMGLGCHPIYYWGTMMPGLDCFPKREPTRINNVGRHDNKICEIRSKREVEVVDLVKLVDTIDTTSPLLPRKLKELTVAQLKAIAKYHQFEGYYKLKKADLIEFLVCQLRKKKER